MVREKIGFVGIQEAWIKPLKPIQGLFKSTYPRYGANGCRGLLWVVHPDFAAFTADMSNEMPSEYHPNVLWIRVTHGDETWYAATVYLPNNTKEARETIEALVKDVKHLPEGSSVIILGDMNGDPFQRKGTNKSVLPLLFSDPRLTLVPRPNDSSFSRPESKAHLDNFVVSSNLMRRIVTEIQYINLKADMKEDSDHLMIILSTKAGEAPRRSPEGFRLQYNTLALREGKSAEYKIVLRRLARRWTRWAEGIREYLQESGQPTARHVITTAYAGLVMTIQSASHQALGVRRVPMRPSAQRFMGSSSLRARTKTDIWKIVRNGLEKKGGMRPNLAVMAEDIRTRGAKQPKAMHRPTRVWVKNMNRDLKKQEGGTVPSQDGLRARSAGLLQIVIKLVQKLKRNVSEGLDGITADHLKEAPVELLEALVFFTAWASEACEFPQGLSMSRAKFVPKPGESGVFRGIRLQSLLAKIIEQLVLHPIFPAVGPSSSLIPKEHMGNKRGISGEMPAVVLAMIAEERGPKPLYAIIADVKGAYDNVWREALWAKLLDAHKIKADVKRVVALYEDFLTVIREPDFETEVMTSVLGVPQGAPRSGDLYCFFTADLPEELSLGGCGLTLFGIFICVAILLDDHMIPVDDEAKVTEALHVLFKYGQKWALEWAVQKKVKVLCINVKTPPRSSG